MRGETIDADNGSPLPPYGSWNQVSFSQARPTRGELLILAGILVLGALLRVYGLGAKSLWLDELVLARSALGDGTLTSAFGFGAVVHPPGYLMLMRVLEQLVGHSDWLVRLPAALFSAAGIAALWALGRSLVGPMVGLAAAFLLAISAFHISYGQELHTYALFATTSTLLLWSLLRAIRASLADGRQGDGAAANSDGQSEAANANLDSQGADANANPDSQSYWPELRRTWLRAWGPFALMAVIALYSHYYAVFTVALCVPMLLIFLLMESSEPGRTAGRQRRPRNVLKGFAATMALVGLLFLPQAIFGMRASMGYANFRVQSVAAGELTTRFTIGPQLAIDTFLSFITSRGSGVSGSTVLVVLLTVFFLFGMIWLLLQPAPQRRRFRLLALAVLVWIILPLPVIAWLAQRAGESFAARRLIFMLPLVVIVEAVGVAAIGSWAARFVYWGKKPGFGRSSALSGLVTGAWLLVVALASLSTLEEYYQRPKQDYRTAGLLLQTHVEPGETVAVVDDLTQINLAWYYPGEITQLEGDLRTGLELLCTVTDAIYLVSSVPLDRLPASAASWIEQNFSAVPLYQVDLYYQGCRQAAAENDATVPLFEQALEQPVVFRGTVRAYEALRPRITGAPASPTNAGGTQLQANRANRMAAAAALATDGKLEEALQEYQAISVQWPDDPFARVRMGEVLLKLGREDDAIAAYESAVEADPTDPNVHFILGYAYRTAGLREKAITAFETALSMDPSRAHAQKVLEELRAESAP